MSRRRPLGPEREAAHDRIAAEHAAVLPAIAPAGWEDVQCGCPACAESRHRKKQEAAPPPPN